jgi:hypothetical protein
MMSFVIFYSRYFFLVLRFTSDNDDFVEKGHNISIIFLEILFLDTPILITPHWDLKFHVDTNASNIDVGAMLA